MRVCECSSEARVLRHLTRETMHTWHSSSTSNNTRSGTKNIRIRSSAKTDLGQAIVVVLALLEALHLLGQLRFRQACAWVYSHSLAISCSSPSASATAIIAT